MGFVCFKCGSEAVSNSDGRVARKDECPKCRTDLHCCKNCKHYDTNSYNECRESQAERVVDKDRGNFCDYFSFRSGTPGKTGAVDEAAAARKKLDDLFK